MQYMGGKAIIARHIIAAILEDTDKRDRWWEPFVGGANVITLAAPHFSKCVGSDIHPDLIMLWQHLANGGDVPDLISPEEYRALRSADPSWMRGFAGFGASFGGKWFGGYGVRTDAFSKDGPEVCRSSARSARKQAGILVKHQVSFVHGGYQDFQPAPGAVIYCDPPYANTTKYSKTERFDSVAFLNTAIEWAADHDVYVSEYSIPPEVPHRLIWEKERAMYLDGSGNSKRAVERLYRILPG